MRRIYHVARADFLQRIRSRKLVVGYAIIAFLGYLVNVGQIELAYQLGSGASVTNIGGTNTAAFVGLKAGVTGATVLLFAGFYVMNSTVARDRRHGVGRLVASTTVSDLSYLAGKWLSNIALAVVLMSVLGVATVLNHLVHGVGPTNPLPLLGPLVVFALPVAAVVAAIAVFFESVDALNGTLGNIAYFFLASFALASLSAAEGTLPSALPIWLRAVDPLGQLAVYDLTIDALLTVVPSYPGGPPSFGTLTAAQAQQFVYTGTEWPLWIFAQRIGLVLPSLAVLVAATWFFDRAGTTGGDSRSVVSRVRTVLPGSPLTDESDTDDPSAQAPPIDQLSVTPVTDRDAGTFWRLVTAELRLAVRGRRWWWYVGAAALIVGPPVSLVLGTEQSFSVEVAHRLWLPLVFVWPIFVWSVLGVKTARHQMRDLVFSSKHSFAQLFAEWLAGVGVGVGLSMGVLVVFLVTGTVTGLLGIVGGAIFAPSLALALGSWSGSTELFELVYLLVWYTGPLNGAEAMDFVGATTASAKAGIPLVFVAIGGVFLAAALARRKLELA